MSKDTLLKRIALVLLVAVLGTAGLVYAQVGPTPRPAPPTRTLTANTNPKQIAHPPTPATRPCLRPVCAPPRHQLTSAQLAKLVWDHLSVELNASWNDSLRRPQAI